MVNSIVMFVFTMLISVVTFAQDKTVDVNINAKGDGNFFSKLLNNYSNSNNRHPYDFIFFIILN